jgi:hypothetical protein
MTVLEKLGCAGAGMRVKREPASLFLTLPPFGTGSPVQCAVVVRHNVGASMMPEICAS